MARPCGVLRCCAQVKRRQAQRHLPRRTRGLWIIVLPPLRQNRKVRTHLSPELISTALTHINLKYTHLHGVTIAYCKHSSSSATMNERSYESVPTQFHCATAVVETATDLLTMAIGDGSHGNLDNGGGVPSRAGLCSGDSTPCSCCVCGCCGSSCG